jgi:hypothetical protein
MMDPGSPAWPSAWPTSCAAIWNSTVSREVAPIAAGSARSIRWGLAVRGVPSFKRTCPVRLRGLGRARPTTTSNRTRSGHPSESQPASQREHERFPRSGHVRRTTGQHVRFVRTGDPSRSPYEPDGQFFPIGVSACPLRVWISASWSWARARSRSLSLVVLSFPGGANPAILRAFPCRVPSGSATPTVARSRGRARAAGGEPIAGRAGGASRRSAGEQWGRPGLPGLAGST